MLVVSWWLVTGPLLSDTGLRSGEEGGSNVDAGPEDAADHHAPDTATVRREWALVHAALALAAALAFLPVYYVLLRFVFPPSG